MEKGILSIFNILAIILILYVIFLCYRKNTKYKKHYIAILIIALACNLAYCIYLWSNNFTIMSVALNINFMLGTWILYFLLAFTNFYTGHIRNKVFSVVLLALVIVDNILFIVNIFNPIMVSYDVVVKNNSTYLNDKQTMLFIYHQTLDYFMYACSAGLLIFEAVKVPSLYKTKYICILATTTIVVILNSIFFLISSPIDFSILLYGAVSVIVYFFGIDFSPILLKHNIEDLVVNEMDDFLIVFDYNSKFFYANKGAFNLFSNSIKNKSFDEFILQYPELRDTAKSKKVIVNNKECYFEIVRKSFMDSHNKLQAEVVLIHDITISEHEKSLREYQRTHDMLTDTFNRTYFIEKSTEVINNTPGNYYVIATNYTGFRLVNDLFGANKGNQVLIDTGKVLHFLFDNTNIVYARMGSDKFAILVNQSDFDDNIIDTIYNKISECIKMLPITLKLGVSTVVNNLVVDAYEKGIMTIHYIKNEYDKKYAFYDTSVGDKEIREHILLNSLEDSIKNHYFELYYQPQVNSYDDTVVGAEVLIRWNHPILGRISPGEFIPLFEKNMVITSLDLFVWEEACRFLKQCQNTKLSDLSISVNISPKDFYLIDVAFEIIKLVDKYEINPRLLKLEITESAFVSDQNKLINTIKSLQRKGFIIEMDDFGSGYSSFNSLKDIPIDVLKLDMKFLNGEINNEKTSEILTSIIGMAHRIHLPIIAEGVETKEQLDLLHEFDCDIIQGYYFAKPMSLDDFLKYLDGKKITSFIGFWTSCDENKEIFSTFKELQHCFNQSPIATLILGPVFDDKKKFKDMIVYYCNPSFLKNEGFKAKDISLKSIKNIYKEFDENLANRFLSLINNNTEFQDTIDRNGRKVHLHCYCIRKRYVAVIITYLN